VRVRVGVRVTVSASVTVYLEIHSICGLHS